VKPPACALAVAGCVLVALAASCGKGEAALQLNPPAGTPAAVSDAADGGEVPDQTGGPTDVTSLADLSADATDEAAADSSTEASDGGVDTDAGPWFPSWADEHGCEPYQFFDGSQCAAQNPAQDKVELACWKTGQVNNFGVGRPCKPGEVSCFGWKAGCCLVDDKKYGAFCTLDCTPGNHAKCGPGAYCAATKKGTLCMPKQCNLTAFYSGKAKQGQGFPCDTGQIAPSGLGVSCTAGGAACKGPGFASDLHCLGDPFYLGGGATSFCTHGCTLDADCGSMAVCVHYNGKPYFCAPKSCAAQFEGMLFTNDEGESEAETAALKACIATLP